MSAPIDPRPLLHELLDAMDRDDHDAVRVAARALYDLVLPPPGETIQVVGPTLRASDLQTLADYLATDYGDDGASDTGHGGSAEASAPASQPAAPSAPRWAWMALGPDGMADLVLVRDDEVVAMVERMADRSGSFSTIVNWQDGPSAPSWPEAVRLVATLLPGEDVPELPVAILARLCGPIPGGR